MCSSGQEKVWSSFVFNYNFIKQSLISWWQERYRKKSESHFCASSRGVSNCLDAKQRQESAKQNKRKSLLTLTLYGKGGQQLSLLPLVKTLKYAGNARVCSLCFHCSLPRRKITKSELSVNLEFAGHLCRRYC